MCVGRSSTAAAFCSWEIACFPLLIHNSPSFYFWYTKPDLNFNFCNSMNPGDSGFASLASVWVVDAIHLGKKTATWQIYSLYGILWVMLIYAKYFSCLCGVVESIPSSVAIPPCCSIQFASWHGLAEKTALIWCSLLSKMCQLNKIECSCIVLEMRNR